MDNYILNAERNGLKTKSSHKMRKTYASMCDARGVPTDFIREQLGHSSLSTTYGYIYNPLTEEETYGALVRALSSKTDPEDNTAENIVDFPSKQNKKRPFADLQSFVSGIPRKIIECETTRDL